jgi:hypothetical protein
MSRQDDPEATVAEGILTETEASPLPALALKRERERTTILGYEKRLLDAGWLRRPPILPIPAGLAGRQPPVSA